MRTFITLALVLFACGSAPTHKEPPMSAPVPEFCAHALELLGLEGDLERCEPALPDQYWVVATGYAGVVVVDGEVPDTERGCAAGAAWLRRIRIYDLPDANPVYLAQGLEWLQALPEGFAAAHLTDHDDRTAETRFTANPFRLELRKVEEAKVPDGAQDLGLGGGALPSQRRAILTGDADYRFTWTVERRDGGGEWEPVSTTPCE